MRVCAWGGVCVKVLGAKMCVAMGDVGAAGLQARMRMAQSVHTAEEHSRVLSNRARPDVHNVHPRYGHALVASTAAVYQQAACACSDDEA